MYRYINPGHIALFQNTPGKNFRLTTGSDKTKTGIAFACEEKMLLPKLPVNIKEIWAKFDLYLYYNTRGAWFKFHSESTTCGIERGGDHSIFVNGSKKNSNYYGIAGINTFWLHLKSGETDGIFEEWINGVKRNEFTGDILHGENIKELTISTEANANEYAISNIIVADTPISLTEQVVTIPCTITSDMTKNDDGSYSATAVNQSLEYAIDASGFGAGTKFTGVNIAARNCIRDGEGVNSLELLEGATSLDTQIIPTAENCGISYGITLNDESPATFTLHNYKLKAK